MSGWRWLVVVMLWAVLTASTLAQTNGEKPEVFATVTPMVVTLEPVTETQPVTVAGLIREVVNSSVNVGLLIVLGLAVVALIVIGVYALKQLQQSIPVELHGLIYEAGKAGLNAGEAVISRLQTEASKTKTAVDDDALKRLLEEVTLLRKEFEAFKPKPTL